MDIYELINKMSVEHKTIFDMPLKVTFYARVSTKKDEQLNSQENQIQTFTDLIKNNNNWTFVEGYVDTIRGESTTNRNNFKRMIADGKSGLFDLIICKEISRFSRDLLDSISYTRELLKNNVGVYFTSDNLCTIDRDSELRLGIMASIAQEEVSRLSSRVKFGFTKAIKNGVVIGNGRIYGYDKKDGKLIINKHESKMIQMIFDLYSTGDYSLHDLSNLLFQNGFRNHSGKPISHTTIKSIIQNPKYKGYYCGNKVKIIDYRTKKQKFLPKNEWIMYKDETGEIVPAIVSEDLWDICNGMLKKRCSSTNLEFTGNQDGKRFTSPLSGKIKCGHCNKSYHHDSYGHGTGAIKWHWRCSQKKQKGSNCPSFSIKENELYDILRYYFKTFIPNVDFYISKYIEIFQQAITDKSSKEDLCNIEEHIKKIKIKQEKMFELYADEIITKNEFKNQYGNLQSQLNGLILEKDNLLKNKDLMNNKIQQLNSIKKYLKKTIGQNEITDTLVLELSKNLIKQIVINPIPISQNGENKAQIIIVPEFGEENAFEIFKQSNRLTIGNISKRMLPIGDMIFTRVLIPFPVGTKLTKFHYDIYVKL